MRNRRQSKKAVHPDDWHPADIKAALEKAGWSLRQLSLHHGYSDGLLKHALHRPYPSAEQLIAQAIGKTPEEIWPSRYDDRRPRRGQGGAPTHQSGPHAKSSSQSAERNGSEKEAA